LTRSATHTSRHPPAKWSIYGNIIDQEHEHQKRSNELPSTANYKLRKLRKPGDDRPADEFDAASLAVPMEIAKLLPEDMRFTPELTDDGILYRPTRAITASSVEAPSWLKDSAPGKTETKAGSSNAKAAK
jgi:hypothetical protein